MERRLQQQLASILPVRSAWSKGFPLSERKKGGPESWGRVHTVEEQPRSSVGRSGCVGDAVPALLDPRCLHGLGGYRAKGPLRAYEPAGLAGVRKMAVG